MDPQGSEPREDSAAGDTPPRDTAPEHDIEADGAPEGGATRTTSRRQWERRPFHRPVRVCELDGAGVPGAEWSCRAADISRGGIGLRSRRMVHVGRHVFVRIPLGPGGKEKLLYGVVKQSSYQEGEGFVIGVKFEEVPRTWAITNWLTSQKG